MTQEADRRPKVWGGDSALPRLSSKSVEWYTPARSIEAARAVMGKIDLDPASCAQANHTVRAGAFYDRHRNGLRYEWPGNVWLNPPYGRTGQQSNQELWTCRLIAQYEAGITRQAILLVNAATDTSWFQRLWAYPICFTDHRIRFSGPNTMGGPTHGSVFVSFGENTHRFISLFRQFGVIARRVSPLKDLTLWSTSSQTHDAEVSA